MLRTWAEVQVVECLPSIWKAMGSISTTVHTHIDAEIQHGSRPVTSDVESESELQTWTWTWPLDLNWTVAWIFQVLWPEFISGAWTWTWILGLLFRTWQWLDFGSGPWTWKWPWALILYLELRKAQKVDRHEPESWEESWILQLHHGHWLWFLTSNLNHVSQSWTWHWTGFFFFLVLGIEIRALCLQGKAVYCFESQFFCRQGIMLLSGSTLAQAPPTFASQIAEIRRVCSHVQLVLAISSHLNCHQTEILLSLPSK
jgi:hypothetical protein